MRNITNFFQRAVSLLASQFQIENENGTLTNFQNLLYAIITQMQEINTQEYLLSTMRSLNAAQGVQLDGIGQIVGLARVDGQPDDATTIEGVYVQGYREDLQFQIFVNMSQGTPEQMIYALVFLTNATKVWYLEVYPAAYLMTTNGLTFLENPYPNPSDLVSEIQAISPAGINFIGITATYDVVPFAFSTDANNKQFYVADNPFNPNELDPFQVNPGSGAVNFYVQLGEQTIPEFGGTFCEAIESQDGNYNFDYTSSGQLAESIQQ